jgi:hypothetical protein
MLGCWIFLAVRIFSITAQFVGVAVLLRARVVDGGAGSDWIPHSIASSAAAPQNIASRLAKHRRSEHS